MVSAAVLLSYPAEYANFAVANAATDFRVC